MQTLDKVPAYTSLAVERLLLQYQEYQLLTDAIKHVSASDTKVLALLRRDCKQVSDEMTFANHIIWLMYKHRAYQGTAKELQTLGQLKAHCCPVDDICHKRWEFLKESLGELTTSFPESMSLEEFYQHAAVVGLLNNHVFLEQWKEQEFYRIDGAVKKWGKI